MNTRTSTNWWLLLLTGIIFMILSVKIMLHPVESIIELAYFIGWACLISGVFQVGFSLSAKGIHRNWQWRLFNGIVNIIFAIIFLSHPAITAKALPIIFGFWMIFIGIATFFTGIRQKNSNLPGDWFDIIIGLMIAIGGIWISYNRTTEAAMLAWSLSLWFMIYGVYFVIGSFLMKKK